MRCKQCKKQIEQGAAFCPYCGARTDAVQENAPVKGASAPAPADDGKAESTIEKIRNLLGKNPWLWVGIAVAGIVLIAGIAFGLSGYNNKNKNENVAAVTEQEATEAEEKETQKAESAEEPAEAPTEAPTEINGVALLSTDTVEGQLQQKIIAMNDAAYSEASIDVYAENYAPGARDVSATWDRTVFYCVEGYQTVDGYLDKDRCSLVKREMKNAITGNIIQYDIYLNPINNLPNKIVSIEYMEAGLEITEYYYDNAGKVNFIFIYTADNYVSTFATPDKTGERYLFRNDCMVTWRSVKDSETTNYVLGDAEVERMKNQFAKKTMVYYSNLSDEEKAAFDDKERKMLNAAYNTYATVLNSEGIAHIQGYVYDGNGAGIGQAAVELYASDFSTLIYSVVTDDSGMYVIYVPNQEYEYNIRIHKEGMRSADSYQIAMSNEQIGAYQDSVYLFEESDQTATVQLTLGDAFEYASDGNGMMGLSGAEVYFRQGLNNHMGDIVYQGVADNAGYLTTALQAGTYTVEVAASGHETMYYTVVANPLRENCFYEFYATPELDEGEYAVVLTWGEYPYDLDSHLFTTAGTSTNHIWYGNGDDEFSSYLDVDDTSSYGPETVTIRQFSASNYYKYCVVDFTNCSAANYRSKEMSNSMACVNVYASEGLIASYYVPTEQEGVIWEVFEIRNGHITPIQRYYGNVEDKTWWHNEK